jgi:glycosyltransferase involved in cell wall biosynthesis
MKIAFDGTVLHGRKSGVGYYCEELLKAMLATNHEDQFHVFSHLPLDVRFPTSNGNLEFANSVHFPIRAVYLHALLPRVLNKVQPDICHYTNFLAPIYEDRPYVVTIHDMGLETLRDAHPMAKRLYTKRLVPHVARKARLIITNSEYSKWQIIRHLGISEDRIRVTPLAAGAEFKPVPVRPAAPYFLYVGNLEPRKNLDRLIEAFARMPRTDHQLVIVGNRWYHGERAERKAKSLGLNGRVRFLGYVPRAELPELFSGATAFVYPSLLEGFGLPIIEAMACGAPVITSNNSSMKEIGEGAALLIDPRNTEKISEALARVAADGALRAELSKKGLSRAAGFSWRQTAQLTLEAYREALHIPAPLQTRREQRVDLETAIKKTIEYSEIFQYPLHPDELRERLFDVEAGELTFQAALDRLQYEPREDLLALRAKREKISDGAIAEMAPHLNTLASFPFIRMIAFSGATAHRNMSTSEDIDLFMIVEDGKLWAVFLTAMVWAKVKGLRKHLCMNYLVSDDGLPLLEHDPFTAQQAASLKPIYGKKIYDRFIADNPFIKRLIPNFDAKRQRDFYPELQPGRGKRALERILRLGFVQIFERLSRRVLSAYFRRKLRPDSDVVLDARRLKLHLHSHKGDLLRHLNKPRI